MIDGPPCFLCLISKVLILHSCQNQGEGRGCDSPPIPPVPTALSTIVDLAKCYQTDHLASRHFGKFILLQVLFLAKLMVGSQLTTALLKIFLKLSSLSCSLDATTKNEFHLRIVTFFFSTNLKKSFQTVRAARNFCCCNFLNKYCCAKYRKDFTPSGQADQKFNNVTLYSKMMIQFSAFDFITCTRVNASLEACDFLKVSKFQKQLFLF